MTAVARPSSGDENWGGRLPLARSGPLDRDQLALADELHAQVVPWARRSGFRAVSAEGDLIGPFNAFLHRPGPGKRYLDWVRADQAESTLAAPLREIIILTIGVAWNSGYEIYAHAAVARHVGIAEPVIAALLHGEPAEQLSATEAAVHRFTDELVSARSVSDDTYRLALEAVGQAGVLDMVNLIGMYLATSALLNAFQIPAPPGE
ncbi:carboxymuconolactone decarboxylase family protein [Nocardia sp. NPDC088792]|uniref:carboxymuconolactone decarboxylase family protein n=1 Tax=Nocardia sp. NPDC088792 TaxID=3364332 RepID=UPI0037F1824D